MELEKYNLQPQQQLAVSYYLKTMNKTEAARQAGYAASAGVFDNPKVKAAIAEQLVIRAERLRVGADWVLSEAVRVYRRCMQTEKVLDRDGNPTGEFRFDANNAVKALTLVGKHVDINAFDRSVEASRADSELIARLHRGRQRMADLKPNSALSSVNPPEDLDLSVELPDTLSDDDEPINEVNFFDHAPGSPDRYAGSDVDDIEDVLQPTDAEKLELMMNRWRTGKPAEAITIDGEVLP